MRNPEEQNEESLPASVANFVQRLCRDPRYLLIGKVERLGRARISFVEGCTLLSATGDVRGQMLLNQEYELRGRPDGDRPYDHASLLDYHLRSSRGPDITLTEEDIGELREESWQYYVRRNFAFLLGDFARAREDAEHNLGIWNLIDQADVPVPLKWSYLRWWPWIERDRAIAQALLDLERGAGQGAATELYRAQRSIEQYGDRQAEEYAQEEEDGQTLCSTMCQHIAVLVELLRKERGLPVSLEERLDEASARGDEEALARLREEMIRRAVGEEE